MSENAVMPPSTRTSKRTRATVSATRYSPSVWSAQLVRPKTRSQNTRPDRQQSGDPQPLASHLLQTATQRAANAQPHQQQIRQGKQQSQYNQHQQSGGNDRQQASQPDGHPELRRPRFQVIVDVVLAQQSAPASPAAPRNGSNSSVNKARTTRLRTTTGPARRKTVSSA